MIAAPRSASGKTTVTLGLGRLLSRRGSRVQSVKSGPDYIDAAFHAAATGRPSLNLDGFAMPDGVLDALASDAASGCDLVLAEGAMGLYDGAGREPGRSGACADLAIRFGWPVILVLDVSGQAETAAAIALGLAGYDPRLTVAGVILNKVASARHRGMVEAGFARIGIPVLGALDRDAGLALPERHLGLVQAGETPDLLARLDRMADAVERGTDLDRLLATARTTSVMPPDAPRSAPVSPPGTRIALAQDDAFSFVYRHVADGWRREGATILPFSPLADEAPSADADCCWLPGGYPELHAGRLSAAARFIDGLRAFAATRPIHGECGGYMVLGEALEDAAGAVHPMAGCLPVCTSFARRRLHLGYRVARLEETCALGPAGTVLRGHEFHYASVCEEASGPADLATVSDAAGQALGRSGHRRGLVSGTFFHAIAQQPSGPR